MQRLGHTAFLAYFSKSWRALLTSVPESVCLSMIQNDKVGKVVKKGVGWCQLILASGPETCPHTLFLGTCLACESRLIDLLSCSLMVLRLNCRWCVTWPASFLGLVRRRKRKHLKKPSDQHSIQLCLKNEKYKLMIKNQMLKGVCMRLFIRVILFSSVDDFSEESSCYEILPCCARFRCGDHIVEGQWHHLVLVMSKGMLKNSTAALYVDGQLINTVKVNRTLWLS